MCGLVGEFAFQTLPHFLKNLEIIQHLLHEAFFASYSLILGQYFINIEEFFMAKKGVAPGGCSLFGIFFGVGNLIFPPSPGALSGRTFLPAIAGFIFFRSRYRRLGPLLLDC